MHYMQSIAVGIPRAFALSLGLVLLTGCADKMAMKDKPMADKMAMKDKPTKDKAMADKNIAHAHIGHVMTGWKDTPKKWGLLPTALAEAKVAMQHAAFAAKKPDNIKWMKAHTAHVLHAVDPSAIAKGPGHGYGVIKAATGATAHIGFSAKSKGASKNVKVHAVHVAASADNAVAWGKEIAALCKQAIASNSVTEVASMVAKIKHLSGQLAAGLDANSDGKITWMKGEGGLGEANKHMGFMTKGEGLTS